MPFLIVLRCGGCTKLERNLKEVANGHGAVNIGRRSQLKASRKDRATQRMDVSRPTSESAAIRSTGPQRPEPQSVKELVWQDDKYAVSESMGLKRNIVRSNTTKKWDKSNFKPDQGERKRQGDLARNRPESATSVNGMIAAHKGRLGLNEAALGKALAELAMSDPKANRNLIRDVLLQLPARHSLLGGDNAGQVAAWMLRSFSDTQLKQLRTSAEGDDICRTLEEMMRRNGITREEMGQLVRLNPPLGKVPTPEQIAEIQNLINAGPTKRQEAIDKTVEYYGIDISRVKAMEGPPPRPEYDESESDFGYMTFDSQVGIGEKAFKSPGVLAATLAHECEIHTKQLRERRLYSTSRLSFLTFQR
jgi:hypothetical protein